MSEQMPLPPQPKIRPSTRAEPIDEQRAAVSAGEFLPDEGVAEPHPGATTWKALTIAAAVAAGIGVGAFFYGGSGADQVSDQERSRIQAEFTVSGPMQLAAVAAADRDRALDGMKLPPAQRAQIATAVDQQQVKLVWITLWDTNVQDGDQVQVTSDNLTIPVTLLKANTTIAIPLPAAGVLNLTGVHDGGGGITIGVLSGGKPISVPVMVVGQQLGIPVVAAP